MTTSLRCFATLGLLLVAPQVGAAASKARAGGPSVSIVAGGDVLLDRGVGRQIQKRGAAHVFSDIAPLLRGADLAFANLECPLARHAKKIARPPAFKADPKMGPALKSAGFDVLSLANNHALDCGRGGLQETLRAVEVRG
jgi:poly-gamma-glutamate synthesis protein (capsule biosynthesis protein)